MSKHSVCKHGHTICPECIYITDAAKRMSDTLNLHMVGQGWWNIRNKWMAFSLGAGTGDGVLYDSREDAIFHQLDERFYAFICFRKLAQGAKPLDCQIFLEINQQAYDSGMRLHEPNAPQLLIPASGYESIINGIRNRPVR